MAKEVLFCLLAKVLPTIMEQQVIPLPTVYILKYLDIM